LELAVTGAVEPAAPTADERDDVRRPWLPGCLAAHGLTTATVGQLSYLVVEEMVEDITVVTVSPWPAADRYGRLRFQDSSAEVAVPTAALYAQLYRGWLSRRPRIGDVFAARLDPGTLVETADVVWDGPLARLLPDGVYDLGAEARKVAKLAVYAVRNDIIDVAEAKENDLEVKAVRSDRPAPHRRLEQGVRGDRR
jgi:hypothetical protein